MRNAFCAGMTQPVVGKRLNSLRSETTEAQSIGRGEMMSLEAIRGVDLLTVPEHNATTPFVNPYHDSLETRALRKTVHGEGGWFEA